MNRFLPFRQFFTTMKLLLVVVIFSSCLLTSIQAVAQIYEPEGLNMPGSWDSWTNPPTNLALANSTQVPNGRIVKIAIGTTRWQTIFSVAASGADLIGGTYDWLYTSGSSSNYFQNKWADVNVVTNTLQEYKYSSGANNSIVLLNSKWYTMNWEDKGYVASRGIFMETSAQPVAIATVSTPSGVLENAAVAINLTTAVAKCAEEIIYLRYTTDDWATSVAQTVTMTGASGIANIPGQTAGTVVKYYAFSSTLANLTADYDMCTIKLNNNGGTNYSYTVAPPPPAITWANLQFPASGTILTGSAFDVFGQALIPGITGQATAAAGLSAWVGYSTSNTNPNTWTNWVPATFNGPVGNNDEFKAEIGTGISSAGTYYYATRFKLNSDAYVYGGYNGGFWNGTTNINGTLTITDPIPDPDFDWVNLQFPANGSIEPGQTFEAFAQDLINGVTGQAVPAAGVLCWIGYSTNNTNPNTWTNWVPASYNAPVGNNDEYLANIGSGISTEGTYYYASRFRLNTGEHYYGGYSATGGGVWNGTTNISGTLVVAVVPPAPIDWANLQFPESGTIQVGQEYQVFGRVYSNGITGQGTASPDMQAWIGFSTSNTNPSTWTNWVDADYNVSIGNNDEYLGNIGPQLTQVGTYFYATRFRLQNGAFSYGGYSATGGGFWDGTTYVSGSVLVNPPAAVYPVLFTIIDGTQVHDNIKFKGQMTNWDTLAMANNNHTWTLTLDVAPGTYEWGAMEGDGTQNGIWLIDGSNLVVTVAPDGAISGTTTYTTYVTDVPEASELFNVYPNPTSGPLFINLPVNQAQLRLFDNTGKVVKNMSYPASGNQLNISELKQGLYILEIVTLSGTHHFQILKTAK